jgi:hypothetical protein
VRRIWKGGKTKEKGEKCLCKELKCLAIIDYICICNELPPIWVYELVVINQN